MRGSVCGDISCCWSVLCNSVKGEHIAVESLCVCWPGGEETPQVDTDTNRVKGEGSTTPQA